jgi:putative transposase
MRRFKSAGQAQRFLAAHAPINNLFRFRRHLLTAADTRTVRAQAFVTWQQVTCVQKAACPPKIPLTTGKLRLHPNKLTIPPAGPTGAEQVTITWVGGRCCNVVTTSNSSPIGVHNGMALFQRTIQSAPCWWVSTRAAG